MAGELDEADDEAKQRASAFESVVDLVWLAGCWFVPSIGLTLLNK